MGILTLILLGAGVILVNKYKGKDNHGTTLGVICMGLAGVLVVVLFYNSS